MVQDVLGSAGRLLVEIGLIGFLLGTCVAYFIMIGDLAPKIIADLIDVEFSNQLRIFTIITLSIFVALPLSLLKKVDSLTSLSILSLILYSSLILKLLFETNGKLNLNRFTVDKEIETITYWNMSGLLTTFPIFSMAMSCQTSLFEIFDSTTANSDLETIRRDNNIIKKAIYMCSFVYITVGLLGYMAFHEQTLYGNILLAFPPSFTTTLTKIGFIVSLLLSFPLCLFPCRTSVYSLTIGKLRAPATRFKTLSSNVSPIISNDDSASNNCDNHFERINKNHDQNKEWIENNRGDLIDGSKFHNNNLILPMIKSPRIIPSNILRLQTIATSNSGASYSYTKLLNDEDEMDYNHLENNNGSARGPSGTSSSFNDCSVQQPARLFMSDFHFKLVTIFLIAATVTLSLLFPHIEFILGIIGSTAGTTVCFVLPAFTFLKIGEHSRTELYLARLLLTIGLAILIFCTYSTIHNANLNLPVEIEPQQEQVP